MALRQAEVKLVTLKDEFIDGVMACDLLIVGLIGCFSSESG